MFDQNVRVLEETHGDAGKNCEVHRGRMPLKTRSLRRVRARRSSTDADSACLADLNPNLSKTYVTHQNHSKSI